MEPYLGTLDLLYRMTNPANVIVVCAKMLQNLRSSHDVHLRRDLVSTCLMPPMRLVPVERSFTRSHSSFISVPIVFGQVRKVGSLAERYSPSNQWYAETMNQVFTLAPSLVPSSLPTSLIRLVAESGEEDPEFRV